MAMAMGPRSTEKLDFSRMELYGRETEIATLHEAYNRVSQNISSKEVVIVHGCPGTGKSALVHTLRSSVSKRGYFTTGRFDRLFRDAAPFSGVADMVSHLCDLIFLNTQDLEAMRLRLDLNLTEEYAMVLATFVPNIRQILDKLPHRTNKYWNNNEWGFEKLKFATRAFLRIVCSSDYPVLLFMDDLQWADPSSLELINTLITDEEVKGMIFLGAYRDNEARFSESLKLNTQHTEIAVYNLQPSKTNQMIAAITQLDPSVTQPLADLVQRKTDGNIFYSIQFLEMLEKEGLLFFSKSASQWAWEIESIKSETNVSENVVELIASKIKKLPEHIQNTVVVAACLGSQFETKVLVSIMAESFGNTKEVSESALLSAAKEGIMVRQHQSWVYRFSHDRILQAAYSLPVVPLGISHRRELHLRIGVFLKKICCSEDGNEQILLIATDQLNNGSSLIITPEEKVDLARLNLKAAEAAKNKSDFFSAVRYLKQGLYLVMGDEEKWVDHYDLLLKLYSDLAGMKYCIGDIRGCQELVWEVLFYARCLDDKLPVYFTLVDALAQGEKEDKIDRVVDIGVDVLHKLGIPHSNPGNIITTYECIKTRFLLRGFNDAKFLSLPEMKDKRKLLAMKMMHSAVFFCWLDQKSDLRGTLIFKMIALTLESGLSKYAAHACVCYGFLQANMGNFDEGFRFGELATTLSKRYKAKECDVATIVVVNSFLRILKRPLRDNHKDYLHAFKLGMETGEVKWAVSALSSYVVASFCSGLPLGSFSKDMKAYEKKFLDYGQSRSYQMMRLYHQTVHNLLGRAEDPLTLTGEIMDDDKFTKVITATNNSIAVQQRYYLRLILAVYFDDFDIAWSILEHMHFEGVQSIPQGTGIYVPVVLCFSGLVRIVKFKSTGKLRHIRPLRKIINLLKKWGINAEAKVLLLEAELVAARKSGIDVVKRAYDEAIAKANTSFINIAALINERASLYFLTKGLPKWAAMYMRRSIDLYSEWGAKAKVQQLNDEYADFFARLKQESSVVIRVRLDAETKNGYISQRSRLGSITCWHRKSWELAEVASN